MQHTISVLVVNQFGVLSRISGLFSGRGFNIESLNVAETNESGISRMTIITRGDDKKIEVGAPLVNGAKVEAELIKNGKNRTVLIFKKRRRKNSRRKNGHRQQYSLIKINKIFSKDGNVISEIKKTVSPTKKIVKKEVQKKNK